MTDQEKPIDALYAAALPLIEERGNQVVFAGVPENYTWADYEDDPARPMESSELVIDRRFWLLLGKPDKLCIGFANKVGWVKWVGRTKAGALNLVSQERDA